MRSRDVWLGYKDSVDECAKTCHDRFGTSCKFFVFGTGSKARKCYWEDTYWRKVVNQCAHDWEDDEYNFYVMK